jgi:hypothetical protein
MDHLVTFLRARLDEDERIARLGEDACWHADYCDEDGPQFVEHFTSDRALREVEAKRQIARWHGPSGKHATVWDWLEIGRWCMECGSEPCCQLNACPSCGDDNGCQTVRHLAAVYADHPEFDERWRP